MFYFGSDFTLKSLDETGVLEGIASDTGWDRRDERFAQGAFRKSLSAHQLAGTAPAMLLHHDPKRPIGRWVEIAEQGDKLAVKGRLTLDAADGREAYALLRDRALNGLSVGCVNVKRSRATGGKPQIDEADLIEISLVSTPVNPRAHVVAVKSLGTVRDLEELLCSAGVSGRKAKAAASAAWRTINDTGDEAPLLEEVATLLRASSANITTNFTRSE